ncbi:MAG: hypothetical protein M9924_21125 [Rhizobiaceae bacterium]|nr:hypothetical protein [Rhizobiaceae bacterium]
MNDLVRAQLAVPSRDELHDFYDSYFETLDSARVSEWPDFFVDDCVYQIIPRENFEAGYQLCTMQGDSKGMLIDRAQAILKTQMFAPRYCRRLYSGLRITGRRDGMITVRQTLVAIQTLIDGPSEILVCGVANDVLEIGTVGLLFKERIVVIDSEMIANSLIYPI